MDTNGFLVNLRNQDAVGTIDVVALTGINRGEVNEGDYDGNCAFI